MTHGKLLLVLRRSVLQFAQSRILSNIDRALVKSDCSMHCPVNAVFVGLYLEYNVLRGLISVHFRHTLL